MGLTSAQLAQLRAADAMGIPEQVDGWKELLDEHAALNVRIDQLRAELEAERFRHAEADRALSEAIRELKARAERIAELERERAALSGRELGEAFVRNEWRAKYEDLELKRAACCCMNEWWAALWKDCAKRLKAERDAARLDRDVLAAKAAECKP